MQGLIDHGIACQQHQTSNPTTRPNEIYQLYFGLGQSLNLAHDPEVFKVSLAGIRLGHYLVQSLAPNAPDRSILDIGTGSGVHALLMRKLGNRNITAIDVCEKSIAQAKINEALNFKQNEISFYISDLFSGLPKQKFQTVIFNPPGWRTPSPSLIQLLEKADQVKRLPVRSMFYGDDVISRFLEDLPAYLEPMGRAIVGLNSLVGIRDVLERYSQQHGGHPPLQYKLAERHTFPLIHYSSQWQSLSEHLQYEFSDWAKRDLAAYSIDEDGNIYWSYEIVEFFHRRS
ncbi:methyltransferase [Pseudomonas sp. CHM02]|uniref:methyltransferase n=1 Tax=Pseudomonas sp. CHM02 TaxID=1463662 RepID=UPI00047009EE|nr:methyltransferase [Pseudomonas sp. CHM02]